jgi:hypothetical protein
MSVYHQMGHQSDNLISCHDLFGYAGAILSPVNYDQSGISRVIDNCRNLDNFETIFDPQLYFPRTEREKLRNWSYFPSDVDTADFSSLNWWVRLTNAISDTIDQLHPDSVCSPVLVPRTFSNEYFDLCVQVSNDLLNRVSSMHVAVYQTVLVRISELADYHRVLSIASIITKTNTSQIYLIFQTDVAPRRELEDTQALMGAMLLIRTLEENGLHVLVGFCSSDIILWKEAGASNCASGKFFNLRRFTSSRWDEGDSGGGQLPYWFEESLLAFLRETDIARVARAALISETSRRNPYFNIIQGCLNDGSSWLKYSWRQFLWWFHDIESRLRQDHENAYNLLRLADNNWLTIESSRIFFDERQNNGSWIRQWLRAISEYTNEW